MHEPMTDAELIAHDGISPEDKDLIEKIAGEHSDCTEGPERANALRGYLVGLWDEMEPDDKFREELDMTAACWSDGWSYCLEYSNKLCRPTDSQAIREAQMILAQKGSRLRRFFKRLFRQ